VKGVCPICFVFGEWRVVIRNSTSKVCHFEKCDHTVTVPIGEAKAEVVTA